MRLEGTDWRYAEPEDPDGGPSWTLNVLAGIQLVVTPLKGEAWFQVCVGKCFYGLTRLSKTSVPEVFLEAEQLGGDFFTNLGTTITRALIGVELGPVESKDITKPVKEKLKQRRPVLLCSAPEVSAEEEYEFLKELSVEAGIDAALLSRALKAFQQGLLGRERCRQLLRDAIHVAQFEEIDLMCVVNAHLESK